MKKIIGGIVAVLLVGTMVIFMFNEEKEEATPSPDGLEQQTDTVDTSSQEQTAGLNQGDTPPDFELTTLDGESYRLSEMQGKKVILNFWASWCGPCKAEMPHMQNYYEAHAEADKVEILAVNMSTQERRGMEGIEAFIDDYGLTFPIPLDREGEAIDDYRVMTIPTTYLIHSDGTLAQKVIGPMDEKTIRTLVDQLE